VAISPKIDLAIYVFDDFLQTYLVILVGRQIKAKRKKSTKWVCGKAN
jgi:hypothetical protein